MPTSVFVVIISGAFLALAVFGAAVAGVAGVGAAGVMAATYWLGFSTGNARGWWQALEWRARLWRDLKEGE